MMSEQFAAATDMADAAPHGWGSNAPSVIRGKRVNTMRGLTGETGFPPCSSGRYWARTSDPQLVELVLSQLS
jgi:hypothetical protein